MSSPDQWHREKWMDQIGVSKPSLGSGQRLVTYAYYRLARDRSYAWITEDRLARETGLSARSCRRSRRELVRMGWLTEIKAADNKHAAHYALTIPDTSRGDTVSPLESNLGGTQSPLGGTQCPVRGDTVSPNSIHIQSSSNLSRGQRAAQLHLLCPDDDERLMMISKILKDHDVRNPEGWIKRVAKAGDLERLLEDGLKASRSGNRPEGWGPSGRSSDEWPRSSAWGRKFKELPECDDPACDAGWITEDTEHGHPTTRRCPTCHPSTSRKDTAS